MILVTGGTGLLGSAIREAVTGDAVGDAAGDAAGADTFVFAGSGDADLRDWDQTRSLFERVRPTHVVHLAARVGGLFANMSGNREFFLDNMSINRNVLEACRLAGVQKVVSCLSTCVFPAEAALPLEASAMHAGLPHPSNEGYSHAKRMLEVLSRLYSAETGRPYVCVIPTNLYGPHDNFDLADAHVLPALVHRAHLAAARGEALRVRGTGTPRRQFLYAADAARLVLEVLDRHDDARRPVVLSTPEEVSIAEAAGLVAAEFGVPVVIDGDEACDGQRLKTSSPADVLALRPDFSFTPLSDGLRATSAWLMRHYPSGVRGSAWAGE